MVHSLGIALAILFVSFLNIPASFAYTPQEEHILRKCFWNCPNLSNLSDPKNTPLQEAAAEDLQKTPHDSYTWSTERVKLWQTDYKKALSTAQCIDILEHIVHAFINSPQEPTEQFRFLSSNSNCTIKDSQKRYPQIRQKINEELRQRALADAVKMIYTQQQPLPGPAKTPVNGAQPPNSPHLLPITHPFPAPLFPTGSPHTATPLRTLPLIPAGGYPPPQAVPPLPGSPAFLQHPRGQHLHVQQLSQNPPPANPSVKDLVDLVDVKTVFQMQPAAPPQQGFGPSQQAQNTAATASSAALGNQPQAFPGLPMPMGGPTSGDSIGFLPPHLHFGEDEEASELHMDSDDFVNSGGQRLLNGHANIYDANNVLFNSRYEFPAHMGRITPGLPIEPETEQQAPQAPKRPSLGPSMTDEEIRIADSFLN